MIISWPFRRVMWATLVLVSVALSFWLLYRFNQVFFVLFIAIVIGTVLRPAVAWLDRRGLPGSRGPFLSTSCSSPCSSALCLCYSR